MTKDEIQRRADKANATLNSEYIKSAIEDLRLECIKVIKNSAHDQTDRREDMYYMLRTIDSFERLLRLHIGRGQASLQEGFPSLRSTQR
jgi:hypothetical protein